MKKQNILTVLFLVVLSSLTALPSYAQSDKRLKAHIPFAFSVRDQTIPADDYLIESRNIDGTLWQIKSVGINGQSLVSLATTVAARQNAGNSVLTFRRYGDVYFLVKYQTPDAEIVLPKSKTERKLQRAIKLNKALAQTPGTLIIKAVVE